MSRYVRAVAELARRFHAPLIPSLSVPEHKPVKTGLLYPDGSPIVRLPNPIGFGRDGEW